MENNSMMMGMTPYESFMMAEKTGKRPNGVGITGLVLGSVATALAIGAWVFPSVYANSRA